MDEEVTSHQYTVETGLPKWENEAPSGNLRDLVVEDLPSGRLRDS
jgi:hypothetical protein